MEYLYGMFNRPRKVDLTKDEKLMFYKICNNQCISKNN